MNEIGSKLIKKIKSLQNSSASFREADLDELQILHRHSKDQFPDSFNRIFGSFKYTFVSQSQQEFLARLLRVLEVENSIPEDIRKVDPTGSVLGELVPTFTLEKKDIGRISELCSAMRKIVFATPDFDAPHKTRLLNRIAAIEAEVHKPKGLFDIVRGGINDLGETLGKFGKDIKPLTERMEEVVKITRRATKEYDQLPPPDEIQQLPKPEDFE
jgi:hypothetical protein